MSPPVVRLLVAKSAPVAQPGGAVDVETARECAQAAQRVLWALLYDAPVTVLPPDALPEDLARVAKERIVALTSAHAGALCAYNNLRARVAEATPLECPHCHARSDQAPVEALRRMLRCYRCCMDLGDPNDQGLGARLWKRIFVAHGSNEANAAEKRVMSELVEDFPR